MTQRRIATLFGGTGFLGHAVVQELAARGYQVRVLTRDLAKAEDMLLMGAVGQIVPFLANVKSDGAVAESLRGSAVVVNLIGELVERGKNVFQLTHVETAARIARIAKAEGACHFIHVSALGANVKSLSHYARTKALGEGAVRAFFPDAVILRPSVMFGPRDRFFNMFALLARFLPFLPLIGGGHTRFQPVYVGDVARAVLTAVDRAPCHNCKGTDSAGKNKQTNKQTKGCLFELGGPQVYTFRELMELMLKVTERRCWLVPVPWWLAKLKAWFLEFLPTPPLTRDQVDLLKTDNVVGPSGVPTLKDLGITPTRLEDVLPTYLG